MRRMILHGFYSGTINTDVRAWRTMRAAFAPVQYSFIPGRRAGIAMRSMAVSLDMRQISP